MRRSCAGEVLVGLPLTHEGANGVLAAAELHDLMRRLVDGAELHLEAIELGPQRRRVTLREGVAAELRHLVVEVAEEGLRGPGSGHRAGLLPLMHQTP